MTEPSFIQLFESKVIHIIERDGEPWFPLADLAEAWGIDRKTPGNLIGRNKDLFDGMFRSDGDITYHDVNEKGLYLLMGKINADRLKNPGARDAMIRFQRWVPSLIQQYRKKEIVPATAEPEKQELDEVVSYGLIEAKQIAELTGTDPRVMQAAFLRANGYPEYADVLVPPAPGYVHGEPGWYNPSGLVELCNDPALTPERLNKWLENYREDGEWRPFQYREGKIWRLTRRGMEHGREYPFNLGNGHSEPRISWRESVLYAVGLKHRVSQDQMQIPARVGGEY
jgi:prophage antirepressor-like protein